MPDSTSTTLRRVRGCVAGGLSGATSVLAHGLAGGGQPPSGTAIALLVIACAVFGASVSTLRINRTTLLPLLAIVAVGQVIGHVSMALGAHHHAGLVASLTPSMLTFHAVTLLADVVLICLAESAAVRALGLLHRLIIAVFDAVRAHAPMWVIAWRPSHSGHGLLLACSTITRGPPSALISH